MLWVSLASFLSTPLILIISRRQHLKTMDAPSIWALSILLMAAMPYLVHYAIGIVFGPMLFSSPRFIFFDIQYFPVTIRYLTLDGCQRGNYYIFIFNQLAQIPFCGHDDAVHSFFFLILWEHLASLLGWIPSFLLTYPRITQLESQ